VFYATGAGLYFLDIVDAFINSYSIVVVGLLEAIVIGWIIGTKNIREHSNSVSIYSIGKWWDIMVKFVTPAILTYMLVQNVITEIKSPYGGYPMLAIGIFGWGVVGLIVALSIFLSKTKWKNNELQIDQLKEVE